MKRMFLELNVNGSLLQNRCLEILCFVIIDDLQCFHRNHVSLNNHQRIINGTSMFER